MNGFELQVKPRSQLMAPETTAALGSVQVADELGFAYLSGDIDFGAVGRNEIFQNIKYIVLTEYFSVPLDREFGMDYSMVDKPIPIAKAVLTQEVVMKIALYEPRAQFREIKFEEDYLAGKLSPTVKVFLITTDELPSSVPAPAGGVTSAAVGGPAGTTIEEIDLPGFYESLIEMARVPGPPGPMGPVGTAATIEVGTTTTGDAGTDVEITNAGDANAAVFDFVIPKGDKGDQGTGVNIKGTVPTSSSLPMTGNQPGDMWIAADTGHGWTWDGDSWNDVGPIQGPVGPQGPQGIAATISVGVTTTGAPGTNADVVNAGTSGSAVFNFTIPRGDVGTQGVQGVQGNTGAQGVPGNAATIAAGTTTTGAPGTNANVSNSGSSSAAVFNFTIPRGDIGAQGIQGVQGNTGSQGVAGPANNLTVAATNTGAPGTNANVVIAGATPNQNLTFTIPRGDVGPTGTTGATGPQGSNAYTTTAANFDMPAVGNSVLVTLADASWVTIGQMVWVQTAGGSATDAYSLKVTAKSGNQVTLKNEYDPSIGAGGDMSKSIYDVNGDNIVDVAASVPWLGITNRPALFTPVTALTASFTCPAYFSSVSVSILSAPWITVSDKVNVDLAGKFIVVAKASDTSITLFNTGDTGNASSGTIAPCGINLIPPDVGERAIFTYQDHFLTGSDGSYTNWTVNGTGATKSQSTSMADHPGIFQLATGAGAGTAANNFAFITSNNAYVYGTGALAFRAVFLAPTTKPTNVAANLSKIFLGLGSQPANGTYPGAEFIGFVFDPSSGMANAANNWGFLTRKASTSTYTDTGFAYSTSNWADLSFYLAPAGANFRPYTWAGAAQAKSALITSNIPLSTSTLCLVLHVVNGPSGTTSYQSYIDSWEVAYRGNTVVPVFRGSSLIRNF